MHNLPTLISRTLVSGLGHYRACARPTLPALLAFVIPLQVCILVLSQGAVSPVERLAASLFALVVTVLSLVVYQALLPQAVGALRARPVRPAPFPREPVRRAILASSLLLLATSLRLGPTTSALPALAVVALFWAAWPWLKPQAALGEYLLKRGTRLWWRSRPAEKLTLLVAFILCQAGIVVMGRAGVVVAKAVGGPAAGWTVHVLVSAGLLPLYLLILANLGAKLHSVPARARA